VWDYNGDPVHPTFSPSVKVTGVVLTAEGEREREEWIRQGFPKRSTPFDSRPQVCHFFVRNGQMQFLNDCTHALAGITVNMPDFPGSEDED